MAPYPTWGLFELAHLEAGVELNQTTISAALTGNLGAPCRVVQVTGSTNADALEWAAAGAPEGALIVADHQTAGRGRWGRIWFSEPGTSLLFSLVLRPRRAVDLLTTALGVACGEALLTLGLPAAIKWPNDVAVSGRKVAGILVEGRWSGGVLDAVVAGVGINVMSPAWPLPDGIVARATNVAAEMATRGLGPPPCRAALLAAVLQKFEKLYPALEPDVVLARAEAMSDVLGREVVVRTSDGAAIRGTASRLLPTGALEVLAAGEPVAVESGEVESVRPI